MTGFYSAVRPNSFLKHHLKKCTTNLQYFYNFSMLVYKGKELDLG